MGFSKLKMAAIVSTLAFCCTTAHASVITIDPDAFASGTNISTAFAGVTLSASGAGADGLVYSLSVPTLASTGTRVFANRIGLIAYPFGSGPGVTFRVDFDSLTDFVAVDVIPDDSLDPATISAFSAANVLLASFTTTGTTGTGNPELASITRGSADIAYITVFDGGNNFALDNLRFNQVPEPATVLLLGLGLAGLGWKRRERK